MKATAKQPAKLNTMLRDIEEQLDRGIANHRDLFSAADFADGLGRKEVGRHLRIEAHIVAKKRLLEFAVIFGDDYGTDNIARGLRSIARLEQKAADAIRSGDVRRAVELHRKVERQSVWPTAIGIL